MQPERPFLRQTATVDRVRVVLTAPDGGVVSVWATSTADRTRVTLDVEVPGVAAGWGVSGRKFAGEVTAAEGRTLTVEVES